ncbi:hypothetical protein COV19_03985 [Candidatus Woesearchaeota archaeon CG10_big_fil_rev_8_21_14_0_10_44_13]|nr:MAG: hypothetical protein COV19_03985 [Candidatus Woesearchaeota archaeon CG10_big_fil_rev_8_21_14_0_10_44_13]
MGIFILYLAWFFIVVKPTFSPDTKMSLPFDDLKESFYNEASWNVNKTPLIIRSNITGDNEPIIVDFPFKGITEQYYVEEKYIQIDEGRLFFLANLDKTGSGSTLLNYLFHSTSNYTQPDIYSDIVSSDESASTDSIKINYNNGLVQQGFFRDSVRIFYYSVKVDGSPIDTSTTSHTYNNLFSKHKVITPQLNHSSYIILNNSRIYNFMTSDVEKTVTIGTRIHQYNRFYINPSTGGAISYNSSQCDNYNTDYIDLYDDAYGLAFIFDDNVNLELCHNKNLSITAEFNVDGRFGYQLLFHSADDDMTKMAQPYRLIYGADEVLEGLSDEKLFYLSFKNYSTIKSDWGYSYDFNVTVLNASNTAIFSYGIMPIRYVTTAGKTYNYNKLDKYGNMSRVSVVLLSW